MELGELLRFGLAILKDHWHQILISLFSIFVGAWWGKRRARKDWAAKEFIDRINFSLNSITDGTLRIRTLIEKNTSDVFLNKIAVELINEAAGRTSSSNALLPLAAKDRWFLLNAVLNELSERFSEGFLRRDLGLPIQSSRYLVCLTYESAGDLKTRKIRVMIVQKNLLMNLPADPPLFEHSHHNVRWQTLHQLARSFAADPDDFLEVELVTAAENVTATPTLV